MNYQMDTPSFKLICQKGSLTGQTFQGSGVMIVLGREMDCQIQINDINISRHHARIQFNNGQWIIEDLNSANGTFINGQRIAQPRALNPSDIIGFGGIAFQFQPAVISSAQTRVDPMIYSQPPSAPPSYPPPVQQYPAYPPQQPVYQPAPIPQPQYAAPPPVYYPPPQKKGSSPCLWIVLIGLGAILCCGAIAAVLYFTGTLANIIPQIGNINLPGVTNTTNGSGSVTLSSAQSGTVNGPNNSSIIIPSGAVPPMQNGTAGSMTFNIQEAATQAVTLPPDFKSYGPVYELGPEGFTFNSPVEIRLPIPNGVDPANIMGLAYLDTGTNTWVMVPGAVDEEAKTISVMSTHLSLWAPFGPVDPMSWYRNHGGYLKITNNHSYNTGSFSGGRNLPTAVSYGVCIASYALDVPADANSFEKPENWTITMSDYHPYSASASSYKWWFPKGTYNLIEVRFVSEINSDPLYVPSYTYYFRPIGSYRIEANQILAFPDSSPPEDSPAWQQGRPPCFGIQDTSVGNGDVQVTLTWQKSIDLDLHVVDPGGNEIYYAVSTSPTGGQLDRDNQCSDMLVGRPENIFWPEGGAPSGKYTILVNYYGSCADSGSVSYTVRVTIKGQVQTYTGSIDSGTQEVTSFTTQ